jgi:ATP-dependent exoDNAse (exonuclease V) beta subunit
MNLPPHVMILASAGSGKTYALTSRFIALLAAGAPPERIVALTFTRKAAGEFFDGILQKLAGAARDEAKAAELARDIGQPALRAADFLKMLRGMADALHQLRLGTLDSFFARIARAFPFELGLAGDFEVLQAHGARIERQRVLQRLFAREGELADAQKDFLEAFKRATFGAEEKQLGRRLDGFLDEHYETFLAVPDGARWGDAARIWPGGQPWRRTVKLAPAMHALQAWLGRAAIEPKQRERWQNFLLALETWSPGAPLPRALEYVIEKALERWSDLVVCAAELKFDRKTQTLDSPACGALMEIVCHVAGGELERRLETTRGIHAVLRSYDALYDALVRRAGKLTFADVERLLLPEGARVLTRAAGGERLFLDYRLDAEIDHWLLDEFQDTSRGQWSVLRNLIDEVVQDAEGRRTFFCVGDVKQSIFAWRAGDPRLMGEIREHYNHGGDAPILTQPLDRSWRSGPAIVEMVNAVFGAGAALSELFPGAATDQWSQQWRPHTTALPERTGQAALLHAEDEDARRRLTLDLLREVRPLEHGLSCAVLVRRNREAAEMADFLRREGGLPAVAESDLGVCTDNPLGTALLALFHAAAHPGDRLAWEHVQMTPFAAALAEEGVTTRDALAWRVLGDVHAHGFERAAEFWLARVAARIEGAEVFARERMRQFAAAAALFDASGSRDVDEFVAFMGRHVVREPESAAVVRVMTIHKSKGLGFDVVIVPELEGNRIDEPRGGLAVQTNDVHEPEWVLEMPPGLFARNDAVLGAWRAQAEQDATYEALSLLYVAMTRAKRAMFVITEPVGDSTSRNFPRLLASTLGEDAQPIRIGALTVSGPWSAGDPDWHRALPVPKPAAAPAAWPTIAAEAAPRRVARRPSDERSGVREAGRLFAIEDGGAIDLGREVHALLAAVEWSDAAEGSRLEREWSERGEAAVQALACLRAPELADVWASQPHAEVWRERAFEIVLGDAWVTGIFDRVVLERDAGGRPRRVRVFDFKTDRVSEAELAAATARHAVQLNLYRRVAAVLAGVPMAQVTCELVFTRGPWRRVVSPGQVPA